MMDKNDILLIYGDRAAENTRRLLDETGLADMIPAGAKIGLKPNLVVARPCTEGATTSPEIVGALIEYLLESGHRDITILEGSWIGADTKRAFKACGYDALSKKYGVPLLDTKHDRYTTLSHGGYDMELSNAALAMDFLINLPVMKGHCQTKITGALKNMKGVISDAEKRKFHALGLHKPIGCLNTLIKTDFALVDGLCGDLDFEEGGNPVMMNRIICGVDPVLVDSYLADTLGYAPTEIEHIMVAQREGVGSADLSAANIRALNKDESPAKKPSTRKVAGLAAHADERQACSACYANLIHALKRMDESGGISGKVCIGQGFREIKAEGRGVGSCTSGLSKSLPGCPPTASEMLRFLRGGK